MKWIVPLITLWPLTAIQAIHEGNLAVLEQLLRENPSLATARIDGKRTLLHVATDWPGHFPNSEATVAALIAHSAGVNAAFIGQHSETPLHWAARLLRNADQRHLWLTSLLERRIIPTTLPRSRRNS